VDGSRPITRQTASASIDAIIALVFFEAVLNRVLFGLPSTISDYIGSEVEAGVSIAEKARRVLLSLDELDGVAKTRIEDTIDNVESTVDDLLDNELFVNLGEDILTKSGTVTFDSAAEELTGEATEKVSNSRESNLDDIAEALYIFYLFISTPALGTDKPQAIDPAVDEKVGDVEEAIQQANLNPDNRNKIEEFVDEASTILEQDFEDAANDLSAVDNYRQAVSNTELFAIIIASAAYVTSKPIEAISTGGSKLLTALASLISQLVVALESVYIGLSSSQSSVGTASLRTSQLSHENVINYIINFEDTNRPSI
jgi:hypothetical protein